MEYDSSVLSEICSSVAVLRQFLMVVQTSSMIAAASCCSSIHTKTRHYDDLTRQILSHCVPQFPTVSHMVSSIAFLSIPTVSHLWVKDSGILP